MAFSEYLNFRLPWNLILEAFFLSDFFSSVEVDDLSLHRYVIFYTNIKLLFFKTVELFKESDSNPFWIPNLEFGIGCNLISWTAQVYCLSNFWSNGNKTRKIGRLLLSVDNWYVQRMFFAACIYQPVDTCWLHLFGPQGHSLFNRYPIILEFQVPN